MSQCAGGDTNGLRRLRVAVVGNSNTVMRDSYARLLQQCPEIDLLNRSIGSTPNVVLLDFLAKEPDLSYDFIIIETAVVDFIQSSGLYSAARSLETLELFISFVRAKSSAEIIILTIPTRHGLLAPGLHWQESLYRKTAARFGIPILDGFRLVRRLIGPRKMNGVTALTRKAARLVSAFGLPPNLVESIAWRNLRDDAVASNALGVFAFVDHTHVSFALHALLADLLRVFMRQYVSAGPPAGASGWHPVGPVIVAVEPIGNSRVARASSLISRDLVCLSAGQTARYQCLPGFLAFGLLINDARTACVLSLSSPAGSTTFDMRLLPKALDWIAVVTPILDSVGDGDIEVTISSQPVMTHVHRLHGTGNITGPPTAEIGEVLLVRSDWRQVVPSAAAASPAAVQIEDFPWATALVADAVKQAERVIRGVQTEGWFIDNPCARFVSNSLAKTSAPLTLADQARLLLAMGKLQQLTEFLAAACNEPAADAELHRMRTVLHDLHADDQMRPGDLLAQGVALVRTGALDEADLLFEEGMARFGDEMGFLVERAWVSMRRKDWPQALDRWELVRESLPMHPIGHLGAAMSLKELGRLDEAEQLLVFCVARFPDSAAVAAHHARTAMDKGDLTEALRRMKSVRDRFATHYENRISLVEVAMQLDDVAEVRREIHDLARAGVTRHRLVDLAIALSAGDDGFEWIKTFWDQLVHGLPDRDRLAQQAEDLFERHYSGQNCELISESVCMSADLKSLFDRQAVSAGAAWRESDAGG